MHRSSVNIARCSHWLSRVAGNTREPVIHEREARSLRLITLPSGDLIEAAPEQSEAVHQEIGVLIRDLGVKSVAVRVFSPTNKRNDGTTIRFVACSDQELNRSIISKVNKSLAICHASHSFPTWRNCKSILPKIANLLQPLSVLATVMSSSSVRRIREV